MIKAFKLKGSSMYPLYREGELILCQTDFDPAQLGPGDCAVYEMEGLFYLHKIKRQADNGFYFSNFDDLPEHFVPFSKIKAVAEPKNRLFALYCEFFAVLRKLRAIL